MDTKCSESDNCSEVNHVEIIESNIIEVIVDKLPNIIDNNTPLITVTQSIIDSSVTDNIQETAHINNNETIDDIADNLSKIIDNTEVMDVSQSIVNSFVPNNSLEIIHSHNNEKIQDVTNISEIIDNHSEIAHVNNEIIDNVIDKSSEIIDNSSESMTIPESIIAVPKTSESNERVQMSDALRGIATAYDVSSDEDEEIRIVKEDIVITDDIKMANYRDKKSDDEIDSDEDSSSTVSSNSNSSSSSSSSNSSDSSSESENEATSNHDDNNKNMKKSKNRNDKKNREKGEYDGLPLIEDLKISVPEVLCDPVGQVGWIVEQMVVIIPKYLKPTLNIDTVLFIERGRRVLGRIFDVFGPVSEPHYCVRFNSSEHIKENNITVNMIVYYCPNSPHTTLVFMTDILKMKATDDVGDDEHPEFSDDEEERAYYLSLKQKQAKCKMNGTENNTQIPKKRPCIRNKTGWKSKHPWNNERQCQYDNNQQSNYNNAQQQNIWHNSTHQYNNWMMNSEYYKWPRPLSNVESTCYNSPSSLQSNVNFFVQPRPRFTWSTNSSTFTPTQCIPWQTTRPPFPSPPPFPYSPPPPPPGI